MNSDAKTWFDQLATGRGNKKGKFKIGMNKCKISVNELKLIKQARDLDISKQEIMELTSLSDYIVTGALGTRYDHILTRHPTTRPHTTTHKAQR